MLTDHAIALKRDNFHEILSNTPATEEALDELLKDMVENGEEPLYVVFYRLRNGYPTWIVLNEEELLQKYDLDTIKGRFQRKFEKVLA